MSDSDDSEYNVEDYITPAVTRHTYNKTDDSYLSEDGDFKESSESSKSEEENEDKSEIEESLCKLPKTDDDSHLINNNGDRKKGNNEPVRTNNRFILYVSNLPPNFTQQEMQLLFADSGQVKSVRIPKKRLGNYAFVEMLDIEGFKNGLKLNGKEMGEKKIRVFAGSKSKKHVSNKAKVQKRKKYEIVQNKIKKSKLL